MAKASRNTVLLLGGVGAMLAAGVLAFVPAWRAGDTDNVAVAAGDGVPDADPTLRARPAPSAEARDRTERQLLELVGVHLGSGGDRAMIRVKNGESAIFRVGDEVFDGRQLVEIHATHVLLRNRGRTERLRMTGRSLRPQPDRAALEAFAESLLDPVSVPDPATADEAP